MHQIISENLSVKQAISKGQLMVQVPAILILLMPLLLSLFITFFGGYVLLTVYFPLVGLILAPLYRNFMITKWRLWAFEKVSNVHELKQMAQKQRLIFDDNDFYEKMEIRSFEEKEKWISLQAKFKSTDAFIDDPLIPAETAIYYSKLKSLMTVLMFALIFCSGAAIFFFAGIFADPVSWSGFGSGIFCMVVAGIGAWIFIKQLYNKTVQLTLNNEGIKPADRRLYKWSEIEGEHLKKMGGRFISYNLVFNNPDGKYEMSVSDLTLSASQITSFMKIYRSRNSKGSLSL